MNVNSTTRMYRSHFGDVFYLPAENDVLISFAPIRNIGVNINNTSPSGKLRLRTWYTKTIELEVNSTATIATRPGDITPIVKILNATNSTNSTSNATEYTVFVNNVTYAANTSLLAGWDG